MEARPTGTVLINDMLTAPGSGKFNTVGFEDNETCHNLHFCINDLNRVITEIDYNYPTMFFNVAWELDKVISAEKYNVFHISWKNI